MNTTRRATIAVPIVALTPLLTACIGPQDRASLATLEGDAPLPSLAAPVRVERDNIGATRYIASSLADAARAQGFVHAQERLAQMDTLRRASSGRLSELAGPTTLATDTFVRTAGFHLAAQQALENLTPKNRALLDAYAQGVNAGIAALPAPPPEFRILGVNPEPWTALDSVNVAYSLSLVLLTGSATETRHAILAEAHTDRPDIIEFLLPITTRFDALADGTNDYSPAPIPAPPETTEQPNAAIASADFSPPSAPLGSNNFAVAGAHTHDGRAILAGDMHLALTMPPIWRHEHIIFTDTDTNQTQFAVGVALPGVPGIIAGSNGNIAWAFTNVTADFADHARLTLNPDNENQYQTSDGYKDFTSREEEIKLRGGGSKTIEIKESDWGPVVGKDHNKAPLALRRTDLVSPINFKLLDFLTDQSIEEAIETAQAWNGPPQNALIADKNGNIAWTVTGYLPARTPGITGSVPLDPAANQSWTGPLDPALRPLITNPPAGYLATANNRTLPAADAPLLGSNQFDLGVRASRIHHQLRAARNKVSEKDLLAIQLDTNIALYEAVRPHILAALDSEPSDPDNRRLQYARKIIEHWNGSADADNTDYRLTRWACLTLISNTISPLLDPAKKAEPTWSPGSPLAYAEPALRILEEQPAGFLPTTHTTYRSLIRDAVIEAMDDIRQSDITKINTPWGQRNTLRMTHPLSAALPWLASKLDMPPHPQPGDTLAVRVSAPSLGASQRLVVSPGHENEGIFHMPGGQSGHPLSPFYRSNHEAWKNGDPTPLLPGPTAHRLTLTPTP